MSFGWEAFEKDAKEKSIVCYGAGVNAVLMLIKENFRPYLDNVLFFVDRDTRKVGTRLVSGGRSFEIRSTDSLDDIGSDTIILVTIADYITVGKMLDEKVITWYPWTVISADISFSQLEERAVYDEKKYFLLNTPDYMNLGDHAITVAESRYLNKNFGEFSELGSNVCHIDGLRRLKSFVKPYDVIFVQGGGNMGSLWRMCEENIRNIVRIFPDNRIVIFPQSVYYGDSEEEAAYFAQSQEVYNGHKDLLICSRDRRSFDFVNRSYKCGSMLLPDMVLTLEHNKRSERRGIGLLLRDDKEKLIRGDYRVKAELAAKKLGMELKLITHHPAVDPCSRHKLIDELLDVYSSCELVITDRLHGMILSAVTNTPCIAFDNSYHKVSDLYKTWLGDCEHITLSEPLDEAALAELIEEKTGHEYREFAPGIFRKEFDKLTAYLNN